MTTFFGIANGVYNSTHHFRILELAESLDQTRYTSRLAGINLDWAGEKDEFIDFEGEWKDDFLKIESEEDTAAYLNNGNFKETFNTLRDDKDIAELVYFSALSMKVGAKIPRKHRRYLKQLYIPESIVGEEARLQFRQAVKEHVNGTPYRPRETGNTLMAQILRIGQAQHLPVTPGGVCWLC